MQITSTPVTIEVKFPLPSTLNEQVRGCRRKAYSTKKKLTHQSEFYCLGCYKFSDVVWMSFHWIVSFRRDPDNVAAGAKFILDGMQKAGVIKNDNLTIIQSPVLHWYSRPSAKGKEGVIVKVSDSPQLILDEVKKWDDFAKGER